MFFIMKVRLLFAVDGGLWFRMLVRSWPFAYLTYGGGDVTVVEAVVLVLC